MAAEFGGFDTYEKLIEDLDKKLKDEDITQADYDRIKRAGLDRKYDVKQEVEDPFDVEKYKKAAGAAYKYLEDRIELEAKEGRELEKTRGTEQRSTVETTGEQQRKGIETGGEQDRKTLETRGKQERETIGTKGKEDRLGTAETGKQQRLGIETGGSEERKNIAARAAEERRLREQLQQYKFREEARDASQARSAYRF